MGEDDDHQENYRKDDRAYGNDSDGVLANEIACSGQDSRNWGDYEEGAHGSIHAFSAFKTQEGGIVMSQDRCDTGHRDHEFLTDWGVSLQGEDQ